MQGDRPRQIGVAGRVDAVQAGAEHGHGGAASIDGALMRGCIDPGREALHERIARRSKEMIDGGLLREVRQLRELGYGPELRPMQAIGYRHIQPVVDGADTLVNALAALETDTRRFARRQRTWIRAVPDVEWFDPADADAIFARVERFLAGDETGAREQGVQTATAEAERGPSRRDARGTRSRAAESAG